MAAPTGNGYEPDPILEAIVKLQPLIKLSEAQQISSAIKRVYRDGSCTVAWPLVVSIAFHESTFKVSAVNKKSKDYGLMQISKANIKRLSLDKNKLVTDSEYSIRIACKILTYNKVRYSKRVSYWLGMYRSGNAIWKDAIRKNAIAYDKIIRKTASQLGYSDNTISIARTP